MIPVTDHNKAEWARMSDAAYLAGRDEIGDRYNDAARFVTGLQLTYAQYDALQEPYRAWLVSNEWTAV